MSDAPDALTQTSRGFGAPDVVLVTLLTVLAVLAAVLGFFHLPWRVGSLPLPASALLLPAVVGMLCRSAHALIPALWAAALPWIGSVATVVTLMLLPNARYRLPLRVVTMDYTTNTAHDDDWRGLLLLAAVVLAAAVQLSLLSLGRPSTGTTERSRPDSVGRDQEVADRLDDDVIREAVPPAGKNAQVDLR